MSRLQRIAGSITAAAVTLTGCTISPAPDESRIENTRKVRPATYDLSTVDITDADLQCEPAADWAKDWVTTKFTRSIDADAPALPDNYFAMVEVGEGEQPGQLWWIVAVISHDDMAAGFRRHDLSFLTDSEQWINVGSFRATSPDSADWSQLSSWSDERIDRGLQAQKKALSCLPKSLA